MVPKGEVAPAFWDPVAPWFIEYGSPLVWLVLLIVCIRNSKRAGELTFGTLVFLSATSMFWLEYYADWGGYLLYNPKFLQFPWGSTFWTAPDKPVWMFFSYGWFFFGAETLMLYWVAKFKGRFPNWGHVSSVMLVALPFFYLWDFALEFSAVATGWWSYVDYLGPAIRLERGNCPWAHPLIGYAIYGALLCLMLSYRDTKDRVWFESRFGVDRIASGFRREVARLGVWSLLMHLLFGLSFVIPINLIREYFGPLNTYVP